MDQVLGVAIAGIPHVGSKHLSEVMDVCYWPLGMASAGHGKGNSMSLGHKVCVMDVGVEAKQGRDAVAIP